MLYSENGVAAFLGNLWAVLRNRVTGIFYFITLMSIFSLNVQYHFLSWLLVSYPSHHPQRVMNKVL